MSSRAPFLVPLATLLAIVAGCGGGTDPVGAPVALSTPSPATTTATTSADPAPSAKSERGHLRKNIGETAGIGGTSLANSHVVFAVTAITVDPRCTSPYADAPENGHFIRVDFNIETRPTYVHSEIFFQPNPSEFEIQGPDGFTDANVSTASSYGCLDDAEQMPSSLSPASKYVGSVVLDSRYAAGHVIFKPPAVMPDGGWEWTIPAA
ncbi:MAG: hypothetical protein ACREXJ_00220 [Gammaproteobacteria bacterium]